MKKLIKYPYCLTLFDVMQSVQNGWHISVHEKRLCLENEKTIFKPLSMPKV